jgi:hypothetical protein
LRDAIVFFSSKTVPNSLIIAKIMKIVITELTCP